MGKKLTIIQMIFGNVLELRIRYFELKDWAAVWAGSDRETEVWHRFRLVEIIYDVRCSLMLA
jgi:hypothetical protein